MDRKLTLDDLAAGLLRFADNYLAFDVFVADVADLQTGTPPNATAKPDGSFEFERQGRRFNLRVFPELGVARLVLVQAGIPPAAAGMVGAAIGAGQAKRGDELGGAALGLVLGLLVGAALAPAPAAPRRVFAVQFDPTSGTWQTYDGGLVRWMKEKLAPPEVVNGLPLTPPKAATTG